MINKLLTKIKDKSDLNSLIKNFISLSLLKVVNLILPLVTLPYLMRVLGPNKYGAIILALSLMAYFQTVTAYGFNLSATREISKHRNSKKIVSYIYSKTLITKIYLLIACLIILIPLIFITPQFKSDLSIYLLMLLMLVGQTLFPEWFFRGIEQMGYITIADLFIKSFFTISVFLFIQNTEDYWLYPLFFGIGYLVVAIYSNYMIISKFKIHFHYINTDRIFKNLKHGFPLFLNQFMPNLFNNTSTFLVGMVLGKTSAGYFGATTKIIQFQSVFNSVVSTVVFPYIIRNPNNFKKFRALYIFTLLIFSIFLFMIHELIFRIIGISYENDSLILAILIFGSISVAIYNIHATNFLIARNYDSLALRVTIIASITGFFLSYPLILNLNIIGAALNIFISQLILGLGAYYYYQRINRSNQHEL